VSATCKATVQARGKPFAFRQIGKQRTGAQRRFLGVAKVYDRLAFRPEKFAMLVGVLRQHTAGGSRNFKAPHNMAVAIGSANQAKINLGGRCQGANYFW